MTQEIRTIRIATQGPAGPAGLIPQASWDGAQVPYEHSTVLAHNGGIWLALRATSVEPSVDVPDDWASWFDFGDMISGFATLDESGKILAAQLPAIAITDTYAAASQTEMLALGAETGDIAIRSDLSKSFILAAEPAATLANWKELLTPTDAVLSVAGRTGAVTLSASDVAGLVASATTDTTDAGNIAAGTLSNARLSGVALTANNLSDLANAATARSNLGAGAASGLATLDSGGKVPAAQLPAIAITDTFTVASQAAMLALTAERGDIAIRSDLNKSYVLATDSPSTLADWKELLTPTDAVLSVAGRTGAVALAQADISGLTISASVAFDKLALGGATVGSNALAVTGTALFSSYVSVASTSGVRWTTGGTRLIENADGVLQFRDAANASFNRLQFGGATSSFPSLKRSGTTLQVRLADDTVGGALEAANVLVTGANGAAANFRTASVEKTSVSGATVVCSALIPAGARVLGIATRITTALGTTNGTSGYQVGDGSDADRYGVASAVTAGTQTGQPANPATADPSGYFAAAGDVTITAVGGNFDGTGAIRVTVLYQDLTAPTG